MSSYLFEDTCPFPVLSFDISALAATTAHLFLNFLHLAYKKAVSFHQKGLVNRNLRNALASNHHSNPGENVRWSIADAP
jgi:hypothetical protein